MDFFDVLNLCCLTINGLFFGIIIPSIFLTIISFVISISSLVLIVPGLNFGIMKLIEYFPPFFSVVKLGFCLGLIKISENAD